MKKLNLLLTLTAAMVVLGISRQNAAAQPNFGGGNFDPQQMQQQMQQRMMDNVREQLVITNDAEWTAIEPLVSKVMKVRMENMMGGMGRGMMGGRGGGPGGPGGMGGRFPGFGQPDPTAETLQKVLEDKAPIEQVKVALAKYRESRKQKAAELAKAQEDLRQVLSMRQEAVMVSMGMLE